MIFKTIQNFSKRRNIPVLSIDHPGGSWTKCTDTFDQILELTEMENKKDANPQYSIRC